MLNNRERAALDRHITGNYGEDQLRGDEWDGPTGVDVDGEDIPESNSVCSQCGSEALGEKSLCCNAAVVTPSAYNRERMRGHITDAATALKFMFAGNAYFTIVSRVTGTRFTFRIGMPKKARKAEKPWWYLNLLNGPDNTMNYTWAGTICSDGVYRPARVGLDAPSSKAFLWMWKQFKQGKFPPMLELWHEGRCGRCGRMLTVPEYKENGVVVAGIAIGIGPECAGRL